MSAPDLLGRIAGPADVKALPPAALPELAAQIRRRLIDVVSRTGGHLGPNLGVVELTIALHRVFDAPRDRIVWDTGHQSYVHKMLTGRADRLGTLRTAGGLSGYPCRAESPHDLVENSHASTALSYADGLARGLELTGQRRHTVAVVGDGALTGGMAWEALNNIGAARRRVVIVLNDNGRSYDETVGALHAHLTALRQDAAGNTDHSTDGNTAGDADGSAPNLLRILGFGYVGPVDGHDLRALDTALRRAHDAHGPVVVHVVTSKGNGYAPAEQDPADRMHTVSPAPKPTAVTGDPPPAPKQAWTDVFGDELVAIGEERADVVALTAAMRLPAGLGAFGDRFPHRLVDVGIAEQHAVTCAAGLASVGLHPVVAVYSTFLGRAFDQVLMDVGLHRLPVTFVLDRAGVTGPDGPSHHGMWDVSLLQGVPGLRLAAPRDAVRLRELLREALAHESGPTVLRYPKGSAPAPVPLHSRVGSLDVLTPRRLHSQVLLVSSGPMATVAVAAAARLAELGVPATVVDPRWTHPITADLMSLVSEHDLVITLEDNAIGGGLGAALSVAAHRAGLGTRVIPLGLPVDFLPVGERDELLRACGLDVEGVLHTVTDALWRGAHWSAPDGGERPLLPDPLLQM
ncbi:1-deoxy-D-xylulose-5-phosphate synthase [Flexivirga sp. ID2601S]|uniref:1-deoxy-D-xylulose-5-phosphate synthase n=1 Tax=Flexivirga aerilata TaxID=1656889 RepID=A0A849AEY1_9MICO|nr:1-deoxy-D-xylulose-5-phosphate synthase [Flexivirga aerilata]NNG38457.1 1-deoxy-D-xylulose-5-phosphate synthase [Flexivirga aerilata]